MKVGSLFSGIGGLELGLERAGMEIVWQVEIDEWCRRVLARHFPNAVRYGDVRSAHGSRSLAHSCHQWELQPEGDERTEWRWFGNRRRARRAYQRLRRRPSHLSSVDLICGGFPCQPVSHAGQRKGDADERWLWPEFRRIIREVAPRWVLVENVPGLLSIISRR